MSWKYLGEVFDIHGGGIDLVFPHHENEIAQSRCAFHTPVMANFWMHNGFLQVEGAEKMSKSLGNVVTIHELLKDWPGEIIRFQMMMTHYRQPIDWTRQQTEVAAVALENFRQITTTADLNEGRVSSAILNSLEDDLNTPQAISELHKLANEARSGSYQAACDLKSTCVFLSFNLEVRLQDLLKRQRGGVDEAAIEAMISARNTARKTRDFKESDRIRDELAKMGVVLKDSKDGTTWEIAR
jgi:cysteinyl-tRNA synthetase